MQQYLSSNTKNKQQHNAIIDMTPMVDLGFLLITFFIFTTTLGEKNTMDLIMPKDGNPSPVKESNVLTAILEDGDKICAYEGTWAEANKTGKIFLTGYDTFHGLGKLIREKQKRLAIVKEKNDLMLLIKPLNQSTYKNLVDALDETIINNVKKYAIMKPQPEEIAFHF